ncbi:hypothetical protein C4D60_Mb09t11860 [Musa balbisiana]|uniref:Uncharacterized protein n=1 Tax=Musa balbisiana TaxID=52838 RepID=A0A4S8IFV2_MUSBA|nr:hypothetical protein C4D60_Mb09t11860 [Musa balbisiana]
MSLHRTSFCFVCSHLASGEKEGDELKRNSDVAEILKSAQFSRICKSPCQRIPERILDHEYGFTHNFLFRTSIQTMSSPRSNSTMFTFALWEEAE